jgi:hypothetical protein
MTEFRKSVNLNKNSGQGDTSSNVSCAIPVALKYKDNCNGHGETND